MVLPIRLTIVLPPPKDLYQLFFQTLSTSGAFSDQTKDSELLVNDSCLRESTYGVLSKLSLFVIERNIESLLKDARNTFTASTSGSPQTQTTKKDSKLETLGANIVVNKKIKGTGKLTPYRALADSQCTWLQISYDFIPLKESFHLLSSISPELLVRFQKEVLLETYQDYFIPNHKGAKDIDWKTLDGLHELKGSEYVVSKHILDVRFPGLSMPEEQIPIDVDYYQSGLLQIYKKIFPNIIHLIYEKVKPHIYKKMSEKM